MRTRATILLCAVTALAPPAVAQVDQQRAEEYFKEVQALCERDGGRLWGVSLCGPMVIADMRTQTFATSQPAPEGARPRLLGLLNAPVSVESITAAQRAVTELGMTVGSLDAADGVRASAMWLEMVRIEAIAVSAVDGQRSAAASRVAQRYPPRRPRGVSASSRVTSRASQESDQWRRRPPLFGATEHPAISRKTLSRSVAPMSNAAAMDTVIAAGISEQARDVLHRHQQLGPPETLPTCHSVCVQQYGHAQGAL